MQSNTTNTSSGTSDTVVLVGLGISLATTLITSITALLTLTYIIIKSKFKDKQTMDIEMSIPTKDGASSKIKISLLNHEIYSKSAAKFDNDKKSKNKKLDLDEKITKISIDEKSLDNNHNGDLVIAETRYKTIKHALDTFAKINQQDLSGSKDIDTPILGENITE
jgi:hypothetical protein